MPLSRAVTVTFSPVRKFVYTAYTIGADAVRSQANHSGSSERSSSRRSGSVSFRASRRRRSPRGPRRSRMSDVDTRVATETIVSFARAAVSASAPSRAANGATSAPADEPPTMENQPVSRTARGDWR